MRAAKVTFIIFLTAISIFGTAGCARDQVKPAETAQESTQEIELTVPEKLPVLENALLTEASDENGKTWAKFEIKEEKEEVQSQYENMLKEGKWEIGTMGAMGGRLTIGAEKEDQKVDILISGEDGKSTIEVTLVKK